MVVDFARIDAVLRPLDHTTLNDHPELANPTSEVLAGWVIARLRAGGVPVFDVAVAETDRSEATVSALNDRATARLRGDLDATEHALLDARARLDAVADAFGLPAEWDAEWGVHVAAERARREAAEAECARLRVELESAERARFAAESARLRDDRDAARLAELATLRVALADNDLILEERERQLTAALTAVAAERARCAAVCREVRLSRDGDDERATAEACAEAIERESVSALLRTQGA
jgi:hypothetical protein